jgi:hypothetical protein
MTVRVSPYNPWTDKTSGDVIERPAMLTIGAEDHPLMSRMLNAGIWAYCMAVNRRTDGNLGRRGS